MSEAPELFTARICKGIPTDCCDYGVIALTEGIEVCRVWTEENARKIARLLNRDSFSDRLPTIHWRCFHCDEVFTDQREASLHFGMDQSSDPACKIKMGAERSLVVALRRAENELADAWAAIHNESTEAAKAYYAQQSRHQDQLRAAEELGYERGLADGRQTPPPAEREE